MYRFGSIYLGLFFILISVLSFFNIIYSYYFKIYLNIDVYIYTLLVSLFFGLFFFIFKKDENKISIFDKILIVLFGYFFIPLILSLPYYLSNYNINFINSYFESISGFTSTGFTIFNNINYLDQSLIIWRSTTQWIGGLYFLFSIILLIEIFDNNLKKSLTVFFSFSTSETLKQLFKIFILYFLLTLFIFLVLKLINLRIFDSFNLSLTIISSGGFIPFNNIETIINSDIKKIILSFTFLFSFFSIFLIYNIIFIKEKNLNFFTEDFNLLIYLIFLLIIFYIFFNPNNNFPSIFLSITSSISNIGIFFNKSVNNNHFLYLLLVIIGGSFFSTSSGIRFFKLFTLAKFSISDLLSHIKPKHVLIQKVAFSEKNVDRVDINKYFLSVLVFVISLFSITILLTISNIEFVSAFKLGILTLMNTVNSSLYDLNDFDFFSTNNFFKTILIFFMIIGRVELLTLFILVKKFLFKN